MSTLTTTITWLGHATFLFELPNGKRVLVDPWLAGNPACPAAFHDLSVDAILVTHGHSDHVGDLVSTAQRSTGPVVAIFELATWAASKGVPGDRVLGMNKGGSARLDDLGITVSLTHAQHSSSFDESDGTRVYLGEACGLVIAIDNAETIYVAGDTNVFSDMKLIRELYAPDVAILPIGDLYTMCPTQAAMAAEFVGATTLIPAHYATFDALTGTPAQFEAALAKRGVKATVLAPAPGERA